MKRDTDRRCSFTASSAGYCLHEAENTIYLFICFFSFDKSVFFFSVKIFKNLKQWAKQWPVYNRSTEYSLSTGMPSCVGLWQNMKQYRTR